MRRAFQEMRRRGLLEEHISEALAPYEDEVTGEILAELVEGKYRKYFLDPDDRRTMEKGKAALVRRGYRFREINAAVRAFLEEQETSEEE